MSSDRTQTTDATPGEQAGGFWRSCRQRRKVMSAERLREDLIAPRTSANSDAAFSSTGVAMICGPSEEQRSVGRLAHLLKLKFKA